MSTWCDRRLAWLPVIVLLMAGCRSGGVEVPATVSTAGEPIVSVAPVTFETDVCADLAAEFAAWSVDLLSVLETMTASEFADRDRWPAGLSVLQETGDELEARVAEGECDRAAIQSEVVRAVATLRPTSAPAHYLWRLMTGV